MVTLYKVLENKSDNVEWTRKFIFHFVFSEPLWYSPQLLDFYLLSNPVSNHESTKRKKQKTKLGDIAIKEDV